MNRISKSVLCGVAILSLPCIVQAQGNLVVRVNDLTRTVASLAIDFPRAFNGISALRVLQNFESTQELAHPERMDTWHMEYLRHEQRLLGFFQYVPVNPETATAYLSACRETFPPALAVAILRVRDAIPRASGDSIREYFDRQDAAIVHAVRNGNRVIEEDLIRVGALARLEPDHLHRGLLFFEGDPPVDSIDQIILSYLVRPDTTIDLDRRSLAQALQRTHSNFPDILRNHIFGFPQKKPFSTFGSHEQAVELYGSLSIKARKLLITVARVSDSWRNIDFVIPKAEIERQLSRANSDVYLMGIIAINVYHLRISLAPFVYQGTEGLSMYNFKTVMPEELQTLSEPLQTLQTAFNIVTPRLSPKVTVFPAAATDDLGAFSQASYLVTVEQVRNELQQMLDLVRRSVGGR